jgi:hypothetical protein
MHFFAWLFGRKESPVPAPVPPKREPAVATEKPKPAPAVAAPAVVEPPPAPKPPALPPEVENLTRWQASGQARAWVDARRGQWDHAAWLVLLDDLQRSPFWPMKPEAIGAVLEEHKREWVGRK